MKTIKGYQYVVTANEDVTITDANGLNLTCPAGQQTYFVATSDEVEVVGDGTVTQTRGGIIAGGGGGGGGEKIAPGEVVVGGTQGSAFIAHLNECTRSPMYFTGEIPEGVTFERLESMMIEGAKDYKYLSRNVTGDVLDSTGPHPYGAIFGKSTMTTLPSTINFASLTDATRGFFKCENLTSIEADFPLLTKAASMFLGCTSLTTVNCNMPAMTSCGSMFLNCTNLTSFSGDISSLTDGSGMFSGCSNFASFSGDLTSLTTGVNMFNGTAITSWDVDLPNLVSGSYMFANTPITSWDMDLPSLVQCNQMFAICTSLTSFRGNLPQLTASPMSNTMFYNCSNLEEFAGSLSSLIYGYEMFMNCSNLTSFSTDNLNAMTTGQKMFYGCRNLKSFAYETKAMTTGENMFAYCNNFSSFSGDLSALSSAPQMFYSCKLDLDSVNCIVTTVPSYDSGSHSITIGVNKNEVTQDDQNAANTILVGKGWTVTWQRN